jgi:hypothetical protein
MGPPETINTNATPLDPEGEEMVPTKVTKRMGVADKNGLMD